MQLKVLCALAAAAFALSACNKSETSAEVQQDVAKAQAEGQRDVADARADAKEASADADKNVADAIADHDADDVAKEAHDANETADKGKSKIMIAQAEADHKVAVEKCDALTGAPQKECKDDADKTLEQAKEAAKVNR
jgi:predicted lipid-binding transport protein (Tim44 family)